MQAHDKRTNGGVEPWTNVQVAVGSRVVVYLWEWVDDRPHRLRVLRSRLAFAEHADEAWQGSSGQMTVFEGGGTSLRDAALAESTAYCYTFFIKDADGEWSELLRERVSTVAAEAPARGRPLLGDDPGGTAESDAWLLVDGICALTDLLGGSA